ncbi:hypothetical protein CLCR_01986 [Cladophialophora carrionii]|uniref:Uncharacterized protein n=1 Tax=Cladophialophora carrionii TaxID=86049 RepID=A0A1C1CDK1_9EURO|nr:hypothetical protein CLCR_01986 [Cladophialophora carrionii]
MSLLPYWLGLRPMTYTSYVKIRGGGNRKSPTPSTYLDESGESESSGSTMEVYCSQTIEGPGEASHSGCAQALEDLDTPPVDLFEEPNPHVVRRDLYIQAARQNRIRVEGLRDQAVLKAKEAIEQPMVTGSQAVPQRPSNVKKSRNKGRTKQRSQETHDPAFSPHPLDPPLPRGALDEQQQHARQARGLQVPPSLSKSCPLGGRRQARQHERRRVMTHARDRGHHRSFASPASTTPPATKPSTPDPIASVRAHDASSPSVTGGPLSLSFSRTPLTRGIYGTRHTDQSTSSFPTSPLRPPRPHLPPQGPSSSPPRNSHMDTAESEEHDVRGRRSQAPSPTPQHQQLPEAGRLPQQQKEKKAEQASAETKVMNDPDLEDICWEVNFLRTVVMRWLGIDSSHYRGWLEDEARHSNQGGRGA